MPDPINWSIALPYYLLALCGGYLLGAIPFGLLLTKLAGTSDIRAIGSGNIGATNVLRTGRKGLAALTLLCDMLKGSVAVMLMFALWGRDHAIIAGFGAFVGHLFPFWLGFKGGKGVATYIGVLAALIWQAAAVFVAVWLIVAAITRYSSLSALLASAVISPLLWAWGDRQEAQLFLVMTALIWLMHRANIARLWKGTEPRIGR